MLQGGLVRGVDQSLSGFVGDRPCHAHTFGCVEGQVETGHRKGRPRHATGVDVCRPAPSGGLAQWIWREGFCGMTAPAVHS